MHLKQDSASSPPKRIFLDFNTQLYLAIKNGNRETVLEFLEKGASPNTVFRGMTLLS